MSRSADEIERVRALFAQLDRNRDGRLSYNEMSRLLRERNPSFTERDLQLLYRQVDVSGEGYVNVNEFLNYIFSPASKETRPRQAAAVRVVSGRASQSGATHATSGGRVAASPRQAYPAHPRLGGGSNRTSRTQRQVSPPAPPPLPPAPPTSTVHQRAGGSSMLASPERPREICLSREDRGRAPKDKSGSYDWLRKANQQVHREARRAISDQTRLAVERRGFTLGSSDVPLQHIDAMCANTRLISPGARPHQPASKGTRAGRISIQRDVVLAVAAARSGAGSRVVAVQAASSFHAGGGFLTGGRHALEEATCVQTTLFASLQKGAQLAEAVGVVAPVWVRPRAAPSGGKWKTHLPDSGCLLSPSVELFRGGTYDGYPFEDRAVTLEAVISVGMPNCNDRMRDSPVDSAPTREAYLEQLQAKWRAVLVAASCHTTCDCLVLPDAGCGVFRNSPRDMGTTLGDLLRTEFAGCFEEVVIAIPGGGASEEFASTVIAVHSGKDIGNLSKEVQEEAPAQCEDDMDEDNNKEGSGWGLNLSSWMPSLWS